MSKSLGAKSLRAKTRPIQEESMSVTRQPRFWLRDCRRCGGDLIEDFDANGSYRYCIQCGGLEGLPTEPVGTLDPHYNKEHRRKNR